MRKLVLSVVLFLGSGVVAPAANWTWIRRGVQAAACTVQGLDYQTTTKGLSLGGQELNSFFTNSQGHFELGKFIAVKAALCAAPIVAAEIVHFTTHSKTAEILFTTAGAAEATVTGMAVGKNYEELDRLEAAARAYARQ